MLVAVTVMVSIIKSRVWRAKHVSVGRPYSPPILTVTDLGACPGEDEYDKVNKSRVASGSVRQCNY